jgi:hypothetical protein
MKTATFFRAFGLCATALWLVALPARAADETLAAYFDNTLVWQNQVSKSTGRLWLNRDGKYYAFYDMGEQSVPPNANGPFRVQGREGTYTLRGSAAPYQLCLWPAAPRIAIGADRANEVYAGGRCYDFTPHAVGDNWSESADPTNRTYRFWLRAGR